MAATIPPQALAPLPGQPVFVQPGVPPAGIPVSAAPGTVIYYPQMQGGAGGIIMVCVVNLDVVVISYKVIFCFSLPACSVCSA